MLTVKVKTLNRFSWEDVELDTLEDSILKAILDAPSAMIAAVYDNDIPVLFISNKVEYVMQYKDKGASFHAAHLIELFGSKLFPPNVMELFPDAKLEQRTITNTH